MAKDLGLLSPKIVAEEKPPLIPRALRGIAIWHNIPTVEAVSKFGRWSMKMIRENYVSGTFVKAGEVFQVPGNIAVGLALGRWAEFVDQSSLEKENAALQVLADLGHEPNDRRKMPEFQR